MEVTNYLLSGMILQAGYGKCLKMSAHLQKKTPLYSLTEDTKGPQMWDHIDLVP